MRLGEWTEFSDFRRWLGQFVVIRGAVPHNSLLVSPGPLGVAGESMDKYNAFLSAEYAADRVFRGLL